VGKPEEDLVVGRRGGLFLCRRRENAVTRTTMATVTKRMTTMTTMTSPRIHGCMDGEEV
jgi:hypothetical protein